MPITSNFRLSPRLRYGIRNNKFDDGRYYQFQPRLRFNTYPMRHSVIEVEMGWNFPMQRQTVNGSRNTTQETGYVIGAGYRLDF